MWICRAPWPAKRVWDAVAIAAASKSAELSFSAVARLFAAAVAAAAVESLDAAAFSFSAVAAADDDSPPVAKEVRKLSGDVITDNVDETNESATAAVYDGGGGPAGGACESGC